MGRMEPEGVDLSAVLAHWKYDESDNVRRVRSGGRELIQVRLPLGIEQYEVHGRPDGLRPQEHESWFAYYHERADREAWGFALDDDVLERLKDESLLYYYRYLLFFQIQEYRFCARDTRRNLEVLDFVARHFGAERAVSLEQYRPYILRMHLMATALDRLQNDAPVADAIALVEEGMRQIRELPELPRNKIFRHEQRAAIRVLGKLREQLASMLPPDPSREIEKRIAKAVSRENYEEAARLRDRLARLRNAERSDIRAD